MLSLLKSSDLQCKTNDNILCKLIFLATSINVHFLNVCIKTD